MLKVPHTECGSNSKTVRKECNFVNFVVAEIGKKAAKETDEVRKMGIGALVVRTAAAGLIGLGVLAGGNAVLDGINGNSAVVEQGYVSPKSLSIQGKKNGTGNIETYLQYKVGDESVSLPCTKGPSGPLCGKVDYWWQSIGAPQREGLVVGEWPAISNDSKRGILGSELQALIDSAYGTKNGTQKTSQQSQK
ncbi:hypothetical protein HYY73_06380 [Candidatus Woesearchaeota archaeon]|nr:hypothetical protein [Candidatus Woesearchaeota archaeon]